MQSLTYGEYTGAALAKVWARKASLPPTPELWRLQNERIKELGEYLRHFQYLGADGINSKWRLLPSFTSCFITTCYRNHPILTWVAQCCRCQAWWPPGRSNTNVVLLLVTIIRMQLDSMNPEWVNLNNSTVEYY